MSLSKGDGSPSSLSTTLRNVTAALEKKLAAFEALKNTPNNTKNKNEYNIDVCSISFYVRNDYLH